MDRGVRPQNSVDHDAYLARYDGVVPRSTGLQALVNEAASIAEVPAAVVNLMKTSSQRTMAAVGVDTGVLAARETMCAAIITAGGPVHVADASLDERWAHNPFVDGRWARVRFYGAHPLVSPDLVVVGTLCVLDYRPRALTAAQVSRLDDLAARAVDLLERESLVAIANRGPCE